MADDPNAPVTRFTAVDVVPEPINLASGNFYSFPNLTQEEIDSIPEDSLEPGIVVYNTTYNVYMAYSAHPTDELLNRWTNINTSLTYKGSGFQAGSPFAIPGGSAVEVEADPQNANPGAMYIDLDTDQPRIFIDDWYDFGPNGTGDSTFTNITVTDTANINNLQVDGTANFTSGLTAGVIETTDLSVTGNTDLATLVVELDATIDGLTRGSSFQVKESDPARFGSFGGTLGIGQPQDTSGITVVVGPGIDDIDIIGSPLAGVITVHVDTLPITPAPSALLGTFTMPVDANLALYAGQFGISLTPSNQAAAECPRTYIDFVDLSNGTDPADFRIYTLDPLAANASPQWRYIIIGNALP